MKQIIKVVLKEWIRPISLPLIVPLARVFVRYNPFRQISLSIWRRIIDPYIARVSYDFESSTLFGGKIAGNTEDMLQRYIYYFGIWEPNLTHWMQRRLASGDTFIDVGANIGYFSLLDSRLAGNEGSVVSIEASPNIFKYLKNNIFINQISNIRAVNLAVADKKKVVSVYRGPLGDIGQTNIIGFGSIEQECEIEALPLVDILTEDEMKNARLIKIDVEGSEWSVVHGLTSIFDLCCPDLEFVIEINSYRLSKQDKSSEEIFHIFSEHGFNAYILDDDYDPYIYLNLQKIIRPIRIRHINQTKPIMYVVFSRQDSDFL